MGIHGNAHGLILILILILVGTATSVVMILTFLQSRQAITVMIIGRQADDPPLLRMTFAQLWPWFLGALIAVVWCYLVIKQFAGGHVGYGAGLLTITLAALLPGVDAILIDEANEPKINEVHGAVMRTLRLAIPFGAVLVLAGAWRIDLTAVSNGGIMGALANVALQITATLFVVYLIWQIFHIWIDRAIAHEDAEMA